MIIPDNRNNPIICFRVDTILIAVHTLYKEKKLNELLSQ